MKRLSAAVLVLSSSAALAAGFELGGDPKKGAETFKTMCASCHGETGKGDGAAAAALNPKPANFQDPVRAAAATDEYIYKMIKDGGAANGKSPLMIAWGPTLGDAKVRDVAAYVRTLAPKAAPAPAKAPEKPAAKPAGKKK